MSNLKNTYGFSTSLLDAIRSVHETTHETDDKISKESKLSKEKLEKDKARASAYRMSPSTYDSPIIKFNKPSLMNKEETEMPKAKTQIKSTNKVTMYKHDNGDYSIVRKLGGKVVHYGTKDSATKLYNQLYAPSMKEEVKLNEADQTYPFKANQLAPLAVQLRSLLNFLMKSGSLKQAMREHPELVEAYIGKEITEEQLEEIISFVDDLMEGRPKGAKNKSKMMSAPNYNKKTEPSKATDDPEEDEDYEDTHKAASRDGRHILPELHAARENKSGASVQTSGGQRHVSQHVATKMAAHLMSLKPFERGEHSAHIFSGSVPKVTTLNHVKTNVLIKQMGSEKKIGSSSDVKRGRGRPKKVV
jgi:hypothetical protein